MKKALNLSLYKSLIESDFTLLNNVSSKHNPYVQQSVCLTNDSTSTLNLLEAVKSIKQLIRMVQFLKKQKLPRLHILVENTQHYFLLKEFLLNYPTKFSIDLQNNFFLKTKAKKDSTEMLFSFEQQNSISENRLLRRLLLKKIFLINKVNSRIEINNKGTYKIYNDLFDFKKIIFLIILFHESINK